jgi:hypothetical protein
MPPAMTVKKYCHYAAFKKNPNFNQCCSLDIEIISMQHHHSYCQNVFHDILKLKVCIFREITIPSHNIMNTFVRVGRSIRGSIRGSQ